MRIYLLSCENREDVIAYWHFCRERFWPDCQWPITVSDSSKEHGWARAMQLELEQMSDKYVMLWLDDQFLSRLVEEPVAEAALACLGSRPDLVGIQLSRTRWANGDALPALPGYALYRHVEPLYNMTQIVAGVWKRGALLDICAFLLREDRPKVLDQGWTGAYNYELTSPHYLKEKGLMVAGPTADHHIKLATYNGVVQNLWSKVTVTQAHDLGYPLDTKARSVYVKGMDPYVNQWRADRRLSKQLIQQQKGREREELDGPL